MTGMVKKITIRIPVYKFRKYSRKNVVAPFIVGFLVLLVTSTCLVAQGNMALANDVAVYAYYLFLIGIILELIRSIKHKETTTR